MRLSKKAIFFPNCISDSDRTTIVEHVICIGPIECDCINNIHHTRGNVHQVNTSVSVKDFLISRNKQEILIRKSNIVPEDELPEQY